MERRTLRYVEHQQRPAPPDNIQQVSLSFLSWCRMILADNQQHIISQGVETPPFDQIVRSTNIISFVYWILSGGADNYLAKQH